MVYGIVQVMPMKINLYEMFCTDTLRSRESARMIAEEVKKARGEPVVIDFKGIIFASRSFCHELSLLLKDSIVKYENMDFYVERMFEALKKPKCQYKIPIEA